MAWQMICNISNERLYIFQNPYNIMEIPAILLYLASFALRYADIIWVSSLNEYSLFFITLV
jgi:hypothetical protein